jgi:hypothetical protein
MLRLMPISTSMVMSASEIHAGAPALVAREGDAQLGIDVGTLEMDAARAAFAEVETDLLEQLVGVCSVPMAT